ncbi:MAG: DUF2752 domain-containing protein [Chitinophagaceae bacterium]|nr:DUF2752 domain-containing protein [Chitinophagaceae bacterium]
MLNWFADHMLPCAYKSLFGIDCPLCGFQRALLLMLQGEWKASFALYPPLLPLLCLGIGFLLQRLFRNRIPVRYLNRFSIAVLLLMLVNYSVKLINLI